MIRYKMISGQIRQWSLFPLLLAFWSSGAFAVNLEKLARDDWYEVKSPNFHVITDAKPEIAETFIRDLENFRHFLTWILGLDLLQGVPPLKILAVHDPDNYSRLDIPKYLGGFFMQRLKHSFAVAKIYKYRKDSQESNEAKVTLMHEYVHYAMANTFNRNYYPLWYNEGIAEYLSTFQYTDKAITLGNLEVIGKRFDWLRTGTLLDLEELFKAKQYYTSALTFYARAAAAVHYFKSTDVTERGLQQYIQLINTGYEIDKAFKESFGKTFEEVDREIKSYLKLPLAMSYNVGEGGLRFPSIKPEVTELDARSVYYYLSFFISDSFYIPDEEKLRVLTESAGMMLDNSDFQVMLADHLLRTDPEKSEAILKEVIARQSGHAVARAVYGDLLLDRAMLKRAIGLDDWHDLMNKARGQYRISLKDNPLYGRPYGGIGQLYSYKAGDESLKEGIVSLDSARFFAHQSELPNLYYQEAMLHLRMRDYKNAIGPFRGYVNLNDESLEFSPGFGRYVYEALAYRELADIGHRQEGERYMYTDGSVYSGGWRNGKPNGEGRLTRASGATFKGTWVNGLLAGKGEFIASNGFHYTGDFKNGEITGRGVLIHPEKREEEKQEEEKKKEEEQREEKKKVKESRGEFFNGMEHGEHEVFFDSGERSVGRCWMGLFHGQEKFYKKAEEAPVVYDRVYGAYRIALGEDLDYFGAKDEKGRAHGNGACHNKKVPKLYWCEYEHGKEVKKDKQK